MITQPKPMPTANAPQEGFVLIVGLVILGLLTMLALSGMRDSTIQEKMAGASRDSGLAFQAAESALRDAENCITDPSLNCTFDVTNNAHFAKDDAAFPEHNDLFNATTWEAFNPPGDPTALAGVPPEGVKYIIRQASTIADEAGGEELCNPLEYARCGDDSDETVYEITARGAGESGAGQSVLRVYYRN